MKTIKLIMLTHIVFSINGCAQTSSKDKELLINKKYWQLEVVPQQDSIHMRIFNEKWDKSILQAKNAEEKNELKKNKQEWLKILNQKPYCVYIFYTGDSCIRKEYSQILEDTLTTKFKWEINNKKLLLKNTNFNHINNENISTALEELTLNCTISELTETKLHLHFITKNESGNEINNDMILKPTVSKP